LVLFVAIASTHLTAQLPLPCLNYTPPNASGLTAIPGDNYSECLKIESGTSEGTPVYVYSNNTVRWYVGNGDIEYDTNIEVGENGEFSIIAMDRGNDEREELQGAWFEPTENYYVPLYEKVEWGVRLPNSVQERIDNFIYNTEHPNETPHTPVLNPYDPEQIDLWADVDYSGHHYRANGFYYVPFERHTVYNDPSVPDPDDWYWEKKVTDMPFRIRFSPDVTGNHVVQIHCVVPGMGEWSINPFRFDAMWNDPAKSFIIKSANGHYYATADNKVFFPVGQNLAVTGCQCELLPHEMKSDAYYNTFDCYSCYSRGTMSPCCGLDEFCGSNSPASEWRRGPWRGEWQNPYLNTNPPAGFMNLYDHLESLSANGGNAAKIIMTPMSFDFEFEELNNYYKRSHNAWELDYLLELCRDLDLRLQLCLNYHPNFGHGWASNWDWTDLDQRAVGPEDLTVDDCGKYAGANPQRYRANCYYNERELTGCTQEPISFFSSENAIYYYKKKIRYFIARYGYSSRITDVMLISETNNIGVRNGDIWNELLGGNQADFDYAAPGSRKVIENWNNTIFAYIKNELQHRRQLLGTGYTGLEAISHSDANGEFDRTFRNSLLDVVSYSSYSCDYDRWQHWSDYLGEGDAWHQFDWARLIDSWDKIVVHSEQGAGFDLMNDIDISFSMKDNWANGSAFFASSGFNWGRQFWTKEWSAFREISNFYNNTVFSDLSLSQSNNWLPQYVGRKSVHDESDDREVIYIKGNVDDHPRAYGIIFNKTWNSGTIQNQFWPGYYTNIDSEAYPAEGCLSCIGCNEFYPISPQFLNQIKLPGFGSCQVYEIVYTQPIFSSDKTCYGTNIAFEMTQSHLGELTLSDFPSLNYNTPFVLFSLKYVSNCLGLRNDSSTQGDASEEAILEGRGIVLNSMSSDKELSNAQANAYSIFDLLGNLIFKGNRESYFSHWSSLPSGAYLVVFDYDNFTKITKIKCKVN
ncbi:MAG: hypothetical protein RL092_1546, partial [Bacteroidota bacterium]